MSSLPACMYMISGGTVILLEIFWTVICHLGLFAQLCSTKHSSLGPASVNMWWKQNRNMPRLFPILQSITVNLYARAVLGCFWLSWKHKAPQGRGDGAEGMAPSAWAPAYGDELSLWRETSVDSGYLRASEPSELLWDSSHVLPALCWCNWQIFRMKPQIHDKQQNKTGNKLNL